MQTQSSGHSLSSWIHQVTHDICSTDIPLISHASFVILFALFFIAIEMNELNRINTAEMLFMIYALGFALEKIAAMQEHGIRGKDLITSNAHVSLLTVYSKGTWASPVILSWIHIQWSQNGFDLVFGELWMYMCYIPHHLLVATYSVYAFLRVYGIYHDSKIQANDACIEILHFWQIHGLVQPAWIV